MPISPENRCRIVLLLFFIVDHLVWAAAGNFERVALFYVVISECVRLFALFAFIASFYCSKILSTSVAVIMAYSLIMLSLGYYGSHVVVYRFGRPMPNIMGFKREENIPLESWLVFYYTCVIISTYMFAAKHISPKKDSSSGDSFWDSDKSYELFLVLSILVSVVLCICYVLFF